MTLFVNLALQCCGRFECGLIFNLFTYALMNGEMSAIWWLKFASPFKLKPCICKKGPILFFMCVEVCNSIKNSYDVFFSKGNQLASPGLLFVQTNIKRKESRKGKGYVQGKCYRSPDWMFDFHDSSFPPRLHYYFIRTTMGNMFAVYAHIYILVLLQISKRGSGRFIHYCEGVPSFYSFIKIYVEKLASNTGDIFKIKLCCWEREGWFIINNVSVRFRCI